MIESKLIADLFETHAAALSLYARQLTGTSEADDAVHDAFVSLMAQRVAPNDPIAWLYRAVRNGAIDRARSRGRRKRRESIVSMQRREPFESRVDDQIDARRIAQMLEHLPGEAREILVLRIWANLGFQQIADLVGCSVSTAHDRYRTCLSELRTRLELAPCRTT